MNPRREREKWEKTFLSPKAAYSEEAGPRRYREPECTIRTEYQRDRDRILHAKAFRRLTHKTQVFIAPEGDHYRTRLTHTLEVAQIARTVARALRLNEDLTEAISLGHDLGHTPFGHAGEAVLDRLCPEGFRHNEQSLRVVDCLEYRCDDYPGLNLTAQVRDGIAHHTGEQRPRTLEGQVVAICDRIAYINHDIDDSLRAGILLPEELPEESCSILGSSRAERIDTMVKDLIATTEKAGHVAMSPAVAKATNTLRAFLFEKVYLGSTAKQEEPKIAHLLELLYRLYAENPELYPEGMAAARRYGAERAAADYVAGMTDRFAIAEFKRHFVPQGWRLSQLER